MPLLSELRTFARVSLDAAAWRGANRRLLSAGVMDRHANVRAGYTDRDHLLAAAGWLQRAQDASADGGVAGRYSLRRGWSSSYPETTGYIIPTFLRLKELTGEEQYRDRARRCVDFLLGVQLDTGAFPGMEIAENRTQPSIFNSAQIVCGLRAWHEATGEERALIGARRATDWLVAQQDADGAWTKHLYGRGTYTYMAHAGCWIAEMGAYLDEPAYRDCAVRHLEWVLAHQDPSTGWFDKAGFSIQGLDRAAVTHTIAYTIWGVLMMSRILGHDRGIAAARLAALQVARRLEVSRRLPGVLDHRWRGQADYTCLTGNAQMALIWFELHRLRHDPALVSTACKALDLVKQAQPMRATEPGLGGGIAGSDPVWGGYISLAIPNWAAKFFIDALLVKQQVLQSLEPLPPPAAIVPSGSPAVLPPVSGQPAEKLRVVLLASARTHKVEQMVTAWSAWGFRPDCVIIAAPPEAPASKRLWQRVERDGLAGLLGRLAGKRLAPARAIAEPRYVDPTEPVADYCRRMGIRCIEVGALDAPASVAALQAERPDLAIYAGAGILRKAVLDVPRLGTLNAHMGILPALRGMNVAEWSRWYGVPVGCTVHLVDPGIDTGDILCCRAVPNDGARSIREIRQAVDTAQIQLLGETLHYTLQSGELPPRRSQRADEGRQYFAMHPEVRLLLERSLSRAGA